MHQHQHRYDYAVILEDDIQFTTTFRAALEFAATFIKTFPLEWDQVRVTQLARMLSIETRA